MSAGWTSRFACPAYDSQARSFTPLALFLRMLTMPPFLLICVVAIVERANSLCDSILSFGDAVAASVDVTVDSGRGDWIRACAQGPVRGDRLRGLATAGRDGRTLVFLASGEPLRGRSAPSGSA